MQLSDHGKVQTLILIQKMVNEAAVIPKDCTIKLVGENNGKNQKGWQTQLTRVGCEMDAQL